jgi:hypothetical protein
VLGDLIGADTVLVCTLPVEPGQYSSCRDASGVRRMALVRKDSIMAGGTVTVDKTGADYTDPVTAAQNAFAGDTWCVMPRWPAQPCVIAIGDGMFILQGTLNIPQGLVVSGAGKGATMLVADNDVETAVSLSSNTRLSGLTIINSQPGGAQTTGVTASGKVQLHDAAIHVAGAAQNVAVAKHSVDTLEILDSDITALGEGSKGIITVIRVAGASVMTLERSRISVSGTALNENESNARFHLRVVDSSIFGYSRFDLSLFSLVEFVRSEVGGDLYGARYGSIHITGSHIKGRVTVDGPRLEISDSAMEGRIGVVYGGGTFDGLQLLGEISLGPAGVSVTIERSYISSPSTAIPAITLERCDSGTYCQTAQLEQTFVSGAQAIEAHGGSLLQSSSSVLAGRVIGRASCTDTYGADYELLNALCQPQPAP